MKGMPRKSQGGLRRAHWQTSQRSSQKRGSGLWQVLIYFSNFGQFTSNPSTLTSQFGHCAA
eukprot:9496607-Karenia_brevis.AAC.1